jgi:hypothetical protein
MGAALSVMTQAVSIAACSEESQSGHPTGKLQNECLSQVLRRSESERGGKKGYRMTGQHVSRNLYYLTRNAFIIPFQNLLCIIYLYYRTTFIYLHICIYLFHGSRVNVHRTMIN